MKFGYWTVSLPLTQSAPLHHRRNSLSTIDSSFLLSLALPDCAAVVRLAVPCSTFLCEVEGSSLLGEMRGFISTPELLLILQVTLVSL